MGSPPILIRNILLRINKEKRGSWKPVIIYSAAYKYVPLVEHNIVEDVRNNVLGAWYCSEAAITSCVTR